MVVVGGGYAGVMAANRLTQRDDVDVTLVNAREAFVERIRLHQRLVGSDDAVVDYADVLAPRIRLVVGIVDRIDVDAGWLVLTDGPDLAYDHLVYAVGSGSAAPQVPGAGEHAYALTSLEESERLRGVLDALAPGAPVVVVGAGPSGIETAAELAETGRWAVTLVCGPVVGPSLHPGSSQVAADRLRALGVRVLDGPGSRVSAVGPDRVRLADGRELASAATVWTAGFGVPDLARRSGLSTDRAGRLLTDETLTSVDDPRVVGAGDAVAPSGAPFRMSCQAAGQLGAQAADTVLAHLAGREPQPVHVGFVGQCLSLGRREGLVQLSHRDDTVRRSRVSGRAAATLKEAICWGTVAQLRFEARRPGLFVAPAWFSDPHRAGTVAAAARAVEPVR
ncbi:NADH dehydrogenase, FAD-containing subunit [Microlunatus flavus]|uniref:NADH dehydrogenase, FAD-containing subunit n=1 Tax=Microlunatus flavus TaxID=1036181 RepID=A0A1H9FMA0_9ACTN|nr:NADH dehydrogenase, FAD-containing subunit [Microlunatus flavus]